LSSAFKVGDLVVVKAMSFSDGTQLDTKVDGGLYCINYDKVIGSIGKVVEIFEDWLGADPGKLLYRIDLYPNSLILGSGKKGYGQEQSHDGWSCEAHELELIFTV
jgi:hypothetical protein